MNMICRSDDPVGFEERYAAMMLKVAPCPGGRFPGNGRERKKKSCDKARNAAVKCLSSTWLRTSEVAKMLGVSMPTARYALESAHIQLSNVETRMFVVKGNPTRYWRLAE